MCFSGLVTIFGNIRFLPIPFRLDISCSLFFGKLLLFIRFISLCNCIKCLFADTEWPFGDTERPFGVTERSFRVTERPFGVTERSFRVTERRFIMRRYNSYCRFAASFLRHENRRTCFFKDMRTGKHICGATRNRTGDTRPIMAQWKNTGEFF